MKTVIEMAREIGDDWWLDDIDLKRFAELVAAAEREACAKVCESMPYRAASAGKAADAIRARSQP